MNRQQFKQYILALQNDIRFESEDDEGAAMYWGELDHIIEVIDSNATNQEIIKLCHELSIRCTLELK